MTSLRPQSPARLFGVLFGLMLLLSPLSLGAQEGPNTALTEAIDAFRNGGYAEAAAQLDALLYPLKLQRPEDIQQARVYLGLSAFILGRKNQARTEFNKVLKSDLGYQLDPVYTPPDILAFFEDLRREILIERPPPSLVPTGPAQVVAPLDVLDFVLSTAPFGIGQLKAGRPLHGGLIFSSQVLFMSGTAGTFLWLQNQPAPLTEADYTLQRGVKRANNALFVFTAAVFAYGTGDALYRYSKGVESARLLPGTDATPLGVRLAWRF